MSYSEALHLNNKNCWLPPELKEDARKAAESPKARNEIIEKSKADMARRIEILQVLIKTPESERKQAVEKLNPSATETIFIEKLEKLPKSELETALNQMQELKKSIEEQNDKIAETCKGEFEAAKSSWWESLKGGLSWMGKKILAVAALPFTLAWAGGKKIVEFVKRRPILSMIIAGTVILVGIYVFMHWAPATAVATDGIGKIVKDAAKDTVEKNAGLNLPTGVSGDALKNLPSVPGTNSTVDLMKKAAEEAAKNPWLNPPKS
jgi:hypothetical protein